MFTFTGHRPMMNNLLNTEYEKKASSRSGAGDTHIRTCIHTYVRKYTQPDDFQKRLINMKGADNV
jgi:hypothetical protein